VLTANEVRGYGFGHRQVADTPVARGAPAPPHRNPESPASHRRDAVLAGYRSYRLEQAAGANAVFERNQPEF
jgi:hypothetical protein